MVSDRPIAPSAMIAPVKRPSARCCEHQRRLPRKASPTTGSSSRSFGRARRAGAALGQHIAAIGLGERCARVLLDHQHGDAARGEAAHQREQLADHLGRKTGGGLVEHHEARLGHQRPRDRQHLPLAAREHPGLLRPALGQHREHRERALRPLGSARRRRCRRRAAGSRRS